ncbi:MAG: cytochrome c5 family protein [Rhodocyclaceae bacterium]|nr:MAG: cytochrome c5 family protein [Rhodocyclaceae bacterium]
MSDHENAATEHKTDLRMAVLAFAFPPAFIIVFAIAIVAYSGMFGARNTKADEEAVAARILPVARVELAASASAAKGAKSGEEVVNGACGACHVAGVAGAPKIGDKATWAPRLAQGLDAMLKSATTGKNAMPPKGGADVTPLELARAIVFMANKSGASFKEPSEKK